MRICSFLPSATEMLYALGLGKYIVGVTHECDYPEDALSKPKVVKSVFDASNMSSEEIDLRIRELVNEHKDIYIVDTKMLKELNPDVIVAQGLCKVCSPYISEISKARQILEYKPRVVMLDPHDLDGILDSIIQLAEEFNVKNKGIELVNSLRSRIEYIHARALDAVRSNGRPKVLCIEWLKPFFTAGHWVPQMVDIAGGFNCISKRGEHSRTLEFNEVVDADPDVIVFMPCGFDVPRALREFKYVESIDGWHDLRAVKNRQVYVVDANSYFSRPSHRLVKGIEILAKIIHPDAFNDIEVSDSEARRVY